MASTDPAELVEQAMALPPAARLALADRLIDSVEEPRDLEWELAWAAELTRRVKEYEAGEVKAISASEALARIRARHAKP
jgi:putative addiction module component (TIGR02574 family)